MNIKWNLKKSVWKMNGKVLPRYQYGDVKYKILKSQMNEMILNRVTLVWSQNERAENNINWHALYTRSFGKKHLTPDYRAYA